MQLRFVKSIFAGFALVACSCSAAFASTECDQLGALEADSSAASTPTAFQDINADALIAACSAEIAK